MAFVTSIAPRTRRNVELLLLVVAFAVALGAYALVGISAGGVSRRTSRRSAAAWSCSPRPCTW